MSSQGGLDAAEIVELYSNTFVDNYLVVAVAALLVYETLITLDQEVRLFWKAKLKTASALFFLIRYWTLLWYVVLGTFSLSHLSDKVCAISLKIQFADTAIQYIPWAALSALRVLALSGMHWMLSTLVFLLSIGPAAVNLAAFGFGLTGINVLTAGCLQTIDMEPVQHTIFSVVARITLIAADFIVVVVTIVATWQRGLSGLPNRRSLSDVLLYNGVLYFLVLLFLNVIVIVLSRVSDDAVAQQGSYLTQLSAPVTAILICRFLLDLQAANTASAEFGTHMLESVSEAGGSMRFAEVTVRAFGADTRHDLLFGDGDPEASWARSDDLESAGVNGSGSESECTRMGGLGEGSQIASVAPSETCHMRRATVISGAPPGPPARSEISI
ncbi:hypothetical protein C8Q77DRAFT_1127983 [Trametes polyzona]|nr:hypothetical protein C8Q77DRAFT_1127983 [Trametes polyzona]